jgi:hypothetical protein
MRNRPRRILITIGAAAIALGDLALSFLAVEIAQYFVQVGYNEHSAPWGPGSLVSAASESQYVRLLYVGATIAVLGGVVLVLGLRTEPQPESGEVDRLREFRASIIALILVAPALSIGVGMVPVTHSFSRTLYDYPYQCSNSSTGFLPGQNWTLSVPRGAPVNVTYSGAENYTWLTVGRVLNPPENSTPVEPQEQGLGFATFVAPGGPLVIWWHDEHLWYPRVPCSTREASNVTIEYTDTLFERAGVWW